ncbi:MAG: cyclase family protein [Bacteroidia bacterium]|nr:cyclase family protein [Bacteroidia bacterium]
MKNLILLFSLLSLISCNQTVPDAATILAGGRWIDLTWNFEESTVYWPTNLTFKHDTVFYGVNDKGYFYSSFKYSAEEHGGTHFDAPLHFAQGGRSIGQIPVEELTGHAVVVDVSTQSVQNRDYLVNTGDFIEWEKKYGVIPEKSIVLLHTGYGKYWSDHEKYTGTLKSGAEGVAELHFPGLGAEAADWLVKERKIKAVGIDTPSIDFGQSKDFLTHRSLCGNNVTAYENIANLGQLPATGSYLVAAPMKIKGGSGSPLRLLAWVKKE